MRRLILALADESVMLLGVVSAVLAAVGADEATTRVVVAAVPFLLAVLVRQVTSNPSTVADVARQTAAALSPPSSGPLGVVTAAGADVANEVVAGVGGLVADVAPKVEPAVAATPPATR